MKNEVQTTKRKCISLSHLLKLRHRWREQGYTVVLCQGCFDLLHVGHIYLLESARKLGDILIVAINDDRSTSDLKGDSRPIVPAQERAVILAALESVDYVVVFGSQNAETLVSHLQPDVYVDDSNRNHQTVEARIVSEYGGHLAVIERLRGHSTSGLIQRIVRAFSPDLSESGNQEFTASISSMKHVIPNVGYPRLEAHELLLRDRVRVDAFRTAINSVVQPGDVVLDLGTGTGILAFFACEAGARHVYAVEREQIIRIARSIAKRNNYLDRIEFIEGDSNDVELPEQVDVLVSECLGSFGLNTFMISDFFRARDKFLKPEGSLIPINMTLFVAPLASEPLRSDFDFWNMPKFGIDFSPMKTVAGNQAYLVLLSDYQLLASPKPVHRIRFVSDSVARCSSQIKFTIQSSGQMIGICGWFDVELTPGVTISTSPDSSLTSWYQVLFPLHSPVNVLPSDKVTILLSNNYHHPLIEWKWSAIIKRAGKTILEETHSSLDGFPRLPEGMTTSYYPSF